MTETIIYTNLACAFISAKWAPDLGIRQVRQMLFLLAELLFGPLILIVLYVMLVNNAKKDGASGRKTIQCGLP
jgi:hypothetical protein